MHFWIAGIVAVKLQCFRRFARHSIFPSFGSKQAEDQEKLTYLFSETFEPQSFGANSFLKALNLPVVEVGPRQQFTSAWSTNAVGVCHHLGLRKISRIERSKRYAVAGAASAEDAYKVVAPLVHDRMTECPYLTVPKTAKRVGKTSCFRVSKIAVKLQWFRYFSYWIP